MAYSVAYLNRSGIPLTGDLKVEETAKGEVKPSTNSSVMMATTLSPKVNKLPPVLQRAALSEPATPCKTLHERIRLFITGCVSRVKIFFAQKKFISDFNRDTSVENFSPKDQYLLETRLNLLNNFFRDANVSDVKKLCRELGGKIKDANPHQLERMTEYIGSLESLARQNFLQEEPHVYGKFFTELSSALMSRILDFTVMAVVKSAYVEAKNFKKEYAATEIEKQTLDLFPKIHRLQILSMLPPRSAQVDLLGILIEEKNKLKKEFLSMVDSAYADVCSWPDHGGLQYHAEDFMRKEVTEKFDSLTDNLRQLPPEITQSLTRTQMEGPIDVLFSDAGNFDAEIEIAKKFFTSVELAEKMLANAGLAFDSKILKTIFSERLAEGEQCISSFAFYKAASVHLSAGIDHRLSEDSKAEIGQPALLESFINGGIFPGSDSSYGNLSNLVAHYFGRLSSDPDYLKEDMQEVENLCSNVIVLREHLSLWELKYLDSLVQENLNKISSKTGERKEKLMEIFREKEILPCDD